MLVLGIETSCDETSAAVVRSDGTILSNIILSQTKEHLPYGGVVPEIAARSHIDHLEGVIHRAIEQAGITHAQLDGIAVTGGPGLIGGVIVGVMMAKSLASVWNKPFIAVNHLEGHALSGGLSDKVEYPFLLLLVSGGHCLLMAVESLGKYHLYGTTIDDALGEAFDKTAKMMGLSYPGGPLVERYATSGKANRFTFPRPLEGRDTLDFSFSGLKTAVRNVIAPLTVNGTLNDNDRADICASFQSTVIRILEDRVSRAMVRFKKDFPEGKTLVVAGGVAANKAIRESLNAIANKGNLQFVAPPLSLCTDNAAMIAWAGIQRFQSKERSDFSFEPRARWPLVEAM
jgi:N6-L-threonylcarbamoyladenine synthase